MNKKKIVLTILCVLALTLLLASPALAAQPPLPQAFFGTLTFAGAGPVPSGAVVEARGTGISTGIEGNPIVTTENGKYGSVIDGQVNSALVVQGDTLTAGTTIEFFIDGAKANQTVQFQPGEVTELNLTVPVSAPQVATNAATGIGTSTATLNGNLISKGNADSVQVSFEWGNTAAYGGTTPIQVMTTTGAFSASLSGLADGTTYHFRAKAVGTAGSVSYGIDRAFTTSTAGGGGGGGGGGETPTPTPTPFTLQSILFGKEFVLSLDNDCFLLQGIEATSADGMLTVNFPKGTKMLDRDGNCLKDLTIAVNPNPPALSAASYVIGLAYDFGPNGATFSPPITFTWRYNQDTLPPGVAEENLVLAYYDNNIGQWTELPGTPDTVNNNIKASVAHFTTFALIGKVPPAAFSVSSLVISPAEVAPAENVNISVSVANTGGQSGSYTIVLKINGTVEQTSSVIVAPVTSTTTSFTVVKTDAGTYAVDVNGLTGSFTVRIIPLAAAIFAISSLSITPAEVAPGENVNISASVANTGGQSGSYAVTLKINGVVEATESVIVDPGKSQAVSFVTTKDAAGTYLVDVNGLSGSFVVKPPPTPPPTPVSRPVWPWIVGGVAAAVVIIGLTIYFIRRRK